MKVTMISNYINHHQIPFSNAFCNTEGIEYCFIQTEPMEEERVKMGWGLDPKSLPYVKLVYEEEEACKQLIMDSDILLVGWQEREELIKPRLDAGKFTIRMSERLYREGQYKAISPRGLLRKYREHTKYRNGNVYLLCYGAYVPSDFHIVRAYPDKMYRFGYFPETKIFEGNTLFENKPALDTVHIVWAGRFMPLKHPEFVTRLAKDLKERGYTFHIHFVGSGEMEEELLQQREQWSLTEEITMYGFQAPTRVREIMEQSHIHLFTSNHLEGWGAVVNEAMNSGCAEVVNSEVGAAPFLVQHKQNGLIYKEGSYEDFLACVLSLFENKEKITQYGKAAYESIVTEWNAQKAAARILQFYENWQQGVIKPPASGPLSVAPVISPRKMYRAVVKS